MAPAKYKQSHVVCKNLVRHHARPFYLASLVLPPHKRTALYGLYAFCCVATEGMNGADTPGERNTFIKKCEELLNRVYAHQISDFTHFIEPAFEQTIARYEIPRRLFEDYLVGLIMDSCFKQPATDDELLQYCYHKKGCVMLMASHLFDEPQNVQEESIALGYAMELLRLSRRYLEDRKEGRIVVPPHWLDDGDEICVDRLKKTSEDFYKKATEGISLKAFDGGRFFAALVLMTSGVRHMSLSLLDRILLWPKTYMVSR